jgi:hypothetical protein
MTDDLFTRIPPTEAAIQQAIKLARRGYLRSEIVRATGLSAYDVSAIKQKIEDEAAQGRCSKTEDLFG